MSGWLSADAVIETDWPVVEDYQYSDAPAPFPCEWCEERFFAQEWLDLHLQQSVTGHGPWERRPRGSHGTRNSWLSGCRCPDCYEWRERRLDYQREWKARKRGSA